MQIGSDFSPGYNRGHPNWRKKGSETSGRAHKSNNTNNRNIQSEAAISSGDVKITAIKSLKSRIIEKSPSDVECTPVPISQR